LAHAEPSHEHPDDPIIRFFRLLGVGIIQPRHHELFIQANLREINQQLLIAYAKVDIQ
jgi:hypothetical protein